VPTLNLSGTCRALDRKDFLDPDRPAALPQEPRNEARAKLAGRLDEILRRGSFAVHPDRAGMGGVESYVQLLTCLELQHDLAAGPSKQNQAANRPAAGPPMRTRPTGLPGQ
jgi:hypothetical protein